MLHFLSILVQRFPISEQVRFRACRSLAWFLPCLLALGCGSGIAVPTAAVEVETLGRVSAGDQPVAGARVQLYAVGNTADGSAATPLMSKPAVTDSTGQFKLSGYSCPSDSTNVYVTATGGVAAKTTEANSALTVMTVIGACGDVKAATDPIAVNEASTVAAVYSLQPFMTSYDAIGAAPTNIPLLSQAFQNALSMADPKSNLASAAVVSLAATQPSTAVKLNALANILATCTTSTGGRAGDNSPCGTLFSLAIQDAAAPTEIVGMLLNIARNPTWNVDALYMLAPGDGPFQPSLTSAPVDWAMLYSPAPAAPSFSPLPGTYSSTTSVTLSAAPNANIFYTTDGSVPTTASRQYSGAFSLSATTLVRAVSVVAGVSSLPSAGTYTLAVPSIAVVPATTAMQPSQSQTFVANVSGAANKSVRWSVSPAVGTISTAGVYTAPAAITQAQTVSIIATSAANSTVTAVASVTLAPPVQVALAPASTTLQPSQTQAFVATVTGAANPAVVWSVDPAVGTISTNGLYTAPSMIAAAQTVKVTAKSVANSAVIGTSAISLTPATATINSTATTNSTAPSATTGTTWYMSPTGSDAHGDGTRANPWLTPNHAGLTCGDAIVAAPGTYATFTLDTTPTCNTHNAVWVQCEVFAACKVNGSQSQGGILVQASYWAVMGWEVTTPHGSSDYASCFQATPGHLGPIHDIYFINDIANGCQAGGFTSSNAVDYFAAVADIAYNAAQGNSYCYSGFSVYQPLASDTAAGTHIYLAQLFSWNNIEPAYCQGGNSTDGEGVILDTFNGLQGTNPAYTQQAVIENVLAIYNGAGGIYEGGSGNSKAKIYIRHNTAYGNFTNTNQGTAICGQIESAGYPTQDRRYMNVNTEVYGNLAVVPNGAHVSGCGSNPAYAYFFGNVDGTTLLYSNAAYSSVGNNVGTVGLTTGFSPGLGNIFNLNPAFPDASQPSAPSCSGTSSVIACMSNVIQGFTPNNVTLKAFGYQAPSSVAAYDPLFPQWLCNKRVPSGLTTMGCSQ